MITIKIALKEIPINLFIWYDLVSLFLFSNNNTNPAIKNILKTNNKILPKSPYPSIGKYAIKGIANIPTIIDFRMIFSVLNL